MIAPKISIIVPVYKVEKEIHRCVESLINQTFNDIEIILVDDGSPDNCPIICDEYAKKDKRIKVIHKENGGLSDARNVGLLEAKADYVLFVDSDDYIDKNTCERFYSSIEANVDVIVGDAIRIEGDKKSLMEHAYISSDTIISGKEFLKTQLKSRKMYMAAWLNLYNRRFLIDNDLFFKKGILHEDEQWTPRVFLKAQKVKYIRFPFYNYIIREDSITKAKDKTQNGIDLINTCYELEKIYEEIDDIELKKLLNDNLVNKFLQAIDYGNFYSNQYKDLYSKKFLIGKPISIKNKAKSYLFIINKRLYKLIYRLLTNSNLND